ncbi:uncharacterized protein L203_104325 [Cryptococcus depauperatus CBS 7841]|uniref:Uncharacterized protein n=1 Tax=Cryptococcus depauperatus CBS 7841 TaxID=1295531 RepID=A0A1E3IIC7_9TREE|nr:CMGC/RCK protein kinase [Cryptococcus depauperatus CBS 7841]
MPPGPTARSGSWLDGQKMQISTGNCHNGQARNGQNHIAATEDKHGNRNGKEITGRRERRDRAERMVRDDTEGDGRVGVEDPCADRSYTELKCLGDGSFGTVWLCDWHSPVKSNTLLSAMQCGAGARPEWSGKRLVALKRMKRVWEGGWTQARSLGELVSLRKIPPHHAIIPLYDAFISPKSHELYFVFECMEGNLYQLTKSRRGRPLAAGLIASCFHQISAGLCHIHGYGYFHRDMKPENLLVTTTGLADYLTAEALQLINSARGNISRAGELRYEKDVSVIVKLADFGLARATDSLPPYTEYVSTRWYRAPEVLLRSSDYGPPVDMWALGTILTEMLNLKPLFPGVSEIDQVYRITETLGDPSSEYGVDERGMTIGGGPWNSGIKLAKNVGFSFPKRKPVKIKSLFNEKVPQSLVDCIVELLRYNPKYRLTSAQCIDHPYFHETLPHLQQTPPLPSIPFSVGQPPPYAIPRPTLGTVSISYQEANAVSRQLPPSHTYSPQDARPAFANGDIRTLPPLVSTPDSSHHSDSRIFFPQHVQGPTANASSSALVHQLRELDLPTDDLSSYGHRPPLSPASRYQESSQAYDHSQLYQQVDDLQIDSTRSIMAPSTLYDGSVYEGSRRSNSPVINFSSTSIEQTPLPAQAQSHAQTRFQQQGSYGHSSANVTAYVQQQQQYNDSQHNIPIPPPIEPTVGAVRSEKLSLTGKKKKWGLSSVFGGLEKSSTTNLATVDENGYSGESLKRTQSGNRPQNRHTGAVVGLGASTANMVDDPKKAKKEAERQAKELARAQREAAAQKQKERARAVMQKRNQLIEARNQTKSKSEIEYSSTNLVSEAPALQGLYATSSVGINQLRNYSATQASQSIGSIRSQASAQSGHSGRSGLSAGALKEYDDANGWDEIRHKARRRDDDDDHSMSSFGQRSLRSRSVLTVGTVDSDPGPRRTRGDWIDPLIRHDKRTPSTSSSSLPVHPSHSHHLMSRSNASLESQLAHDFKIRANVGAASSTSSLGHLAQPQTLSHIAQVPVHSTSASQRSLPTGHGHGLEVSYPETVLEGHDSAPINIYGTPKANTVAMSAEIARQRGQIPVQSGTVLPSIGDWREVGGGKINPMFRVPPADYDEQRHQTLPPFSAIANVAFEGQVKQQKQQQQQLQQYHQ